MKPLLLIGLGGFLGAVARHLFATALDRWMQPSIFPWGILATNVLGCLAIGMVFGAFSTQGVPDPVRGFIVTGVIGGFTTFSTFSYNTLELIRKGQVTAGLANVGASVILGFLAVWVGYQLMSGRNVS